MPDQPAPAALPDSVAFRVLADSPISMVLSDPGQPDMPIVYVNRAFERVTGYSTEAVLGRNCRFLQGEETDPDDVKAIRRALEREEETTVDILNYRADGAPFMNRLLLTPIHDAEGRLQYFLGIQKRLTDWERRHSVNASQRTVRELQHRVKNHLAMIVGLIRLDTRDATPGSLRALARRVESLQVLYDELTKPQEAPAGGDISLGAYLSRLASTTANLDGRPGIRMNIAVSDVTCHSDMAARIGLTVSEILTNALQHAFEGRDRGRLDLRLHDTADGRIAIVVADDGVGIPADREWPNMKSVGGRVVAGLINDLGADLDVTSGADGTTIRLEIPQDGQQE